MSRTTERLWGSGLNLLSTGLLAGTVLVVAHLYGSPALPTRVDFDVERSFDAHEGQSAAPRNASHEALVKKPMSKTIIQTTELKVAAKAALDTLIRVKGILDFGSPDANEAIVEILGSRKTVTCKVGQTVEEVGAVVEKIDTAVTFQYDNKSITLKIQSEDQVDGRFLAFPEGTFSGKDWAGR